MSAQRTYPANVIPPSFVQNAKATFERSPSRRPEGNNHWDAVRASAELDPAGRALVLGGDERDGEPDDRARRRADMRAGQLPPLGRGAPAAASGARMMLSRPNPTWTWLTGDLASELGRRHSSPIRTTRSGNTLYLGTGEANRCSSGCEAGVGIYKSTNGGDNWTKLADACVSNATYSCVNSGRRVPRSRDRPDRDRPDEREPHLRRLGAGRSRPLARDRQRRRRPRFEPGANPVGLYESTDGGSDIHRGLERQRRGTRSASPTSRSTRSIRRPCTPRRSTRASGGGRRRSTASLAAVRFQQVFAPAVRRGGGTDRTMFAATVKNGKTRIYLTDGTANGAARSRPANFWRTDNADQPAAALLASQAPGSTVPPGDGNPFPAIYNGWQKLTSQHDREPVLRDERLLHGPVLVRRGRLHAGRHARHRLRDRLVQLRRAAVQHEGRRLRERPLERPRGASTRRPPVIRTPRRPARRSTARSPT